MDAKLKSCIDCTWTGGVVGCEVCKDKSGFTPQRPSTPKASEATKHDPGKARYDLIPADALYGLAQVYTQGAEKYGDYNWELGMEWRRVYAALQRHANKWWRGEAYDQEDGQHHLLSVIWCAMTLYAYEARGLGTDTRPALEEFDPDFWRKPDDRKSDKRAPAAQ